MTAQEKIFQMARENTGSHFLDSGLAYGYHYERPIPARELSVFLYFEDDGSITDFDVSISTPHFLARWLDEDEVSEAMEREFQAFLDSEEHREHPWLQCMEEFADEKGLDVSLVVNTYNSDADLDQVFQFVLFYEDGDAYVLLHTHNGCDVRGGYSRPHVFRVIDEDCFLDWEVHYDCLRCKDEVRKGEVSAALRPGADPETSDPDDLVLTHAKCGGEVSLYSTVNGC